MDILKRTAQEMFGLPYLFPYQRLVISNILRRSGFFSKEEAEEAPPNQIVLLPTGAGKSLCFMLPAILLSGVTIVIFPLLGLMADQLRRVREAGINGAVLKGGMKKEEKDALWKGLADGTIRILLTNPEMLTRPEVQEKLLGIQIAHLVIDEAHTIPEWGETFRPACLELGTILRTLTIGQITAFTATASPLILEKIEAYLLKDRPFNLVKANPDRTNIFYEVQPVLSRVPALESLLQEAERPVLIFCRTRRECEQTAFQLQIRLKDPEIRFYHAGLSPELRTLREKWFFTSERGILASTCAYGMGMDKSNIRTVIHLALPSSVEAYLQESGRGGRDRQPCRAVLLYHPEDRNREEHNPEGELRERYEKLVAFAEETTRCRRESLLAILEAEPEDCAGCDVCRGNVLVEDPAEEPVLETLRLYKRRFTRKMFREFLTGRYTREILQGRYHRSPGFGLLGEWDPDDVDHILEGLTFSGKIRVIARGSWKGRLTLPGSRL